MVDTDMGETYNRQDIEKLFYEIRDKSFHDYCSRCRLKFGHRKMRGYSSPFDGNVHINLRLIANMGKDALIGLLAHELGHQVSYKKRRIVKRFIFLRNYYNNLEKRRIVEKEADMIAIERGYAQELLEDRKIQQAAYVNYPKRLEEVKKTYLTYDELKGYIGRDSTAQ